MEPAFACLLEKIKDDVGFSPVAYLSDSGFWSIGYGHNLENGRLSPEGLHWSEEFATRRLVSQLTELEQQVKGICLQQGVDLDRGRLLVLVAIAFHLGLSELTRQHRLFSALRFSYYSRAAKELSAYPWPEELAGLAKEWSMSMEEGGFASKPSSFWGRLSNKLANTFQFFK